MFILDFVYIILYNVYGGFMYSNRNYLPHLVKNRIAAVVMYRNTKNINYICRKYHISRSSLWRWNKKYDGTVESLLDKSHKPISKHPNQHTDKEIYNIKCYIKRNPNITLNELWYKLKRNKEYKRHPTSLYRVCKKIGFFKNVNVKMHTSYIPKKYNTPNNMGEKWQLDVKYIPKECKVDNLPYDKRYYQYTVIDEATRERYIFPYEEKTPENTVNFIQRAIKYFGYKPKMIQTDNGTEFTYFKETKVVHQFDKFCDNNKIMHKLIKPRTPRHNGKVERSHRNDNERFYCNLKFYSYEDLKKQMASYLRRSNNIPMSVLNYLTPKEMHKKLELENKIYLVA